MVFGALLSLGKKALHNAGSGLNFFGSKLKGGIDWLKGTYNKVDKTLKAIPVVSSVYEQAKKTPIPGLGKTPEELGGVASQALDIGEKVAGVAMARSFGEGIARARGLGQMLPESERRAFDRGLGVVEGARTLLRRRM